MGGECRGILFKSHASPFDEMIFKGKAVATIVNGEFVMKDGVVLK